MHHPDYTLPREVHWLCEPCHIGWHNHLKTLTKTAWEDWAAGSKIVSRETNTEALENA